MTPTTTEQPRPQQHPLPPFATLLRHLIDTVHPPDREPYTYREIATGIDTLTAHEHRHDGPA
ncbi:hypothetical protein [Salinifilum ghardaiensis]